MAQRGTLTVLPDADRVEHALVEATRTRAFVDARAFCSFAELVHRCEPTRERNAAVQSPLAIRLLVGELAQGLPEGPFGEAVRSPVFARSASGLFEHLAMQNSLPAELATAAAKLHGSSGERLAWLATLWRALDEALVARGWLDRAGVLKAACARLDRGLPPSLRGLESVRFEGLLDWPPLHLRLVTALAEAFQRAKHGSVQVVLPWLGVPSLDAMVAEVLRALERDAQNLPLELEMADPPPGREVFTRFGAPGEPTLEPAPWLELVTCATPRDEVRALAAAARARVDAGTPPEQVAIVFRDLEGEAEALAGWLAKVGLPARVRLGAPLPDTVPGGLALGLVTLADEQFPVGAVVRWLEQRLVRLGDRRVRAPSRWLALAGVRDDRLGAAPDESAYAVRLESLARRLENQAPMRNAGPAAEVRAVAAGCARLIAVASTLPARATLHEHLARWSAAVEALGLGAPPPLEPPSGTIASMAVERALARDHAALEALAELRTALLREVPAEGLGRVVLDRAAFARWLEDAASDVNLPSFGPRAGAVSVLEARGVAGRTFEHVLFGGLVEGRMPGKPAPVPLLPPEEVDALNAAAGRRLVRVIAGEPREALPVRLGEDRLLFYVVTAAAQKGVLWSHAQRDAKGRELVRSTFVDELVRWAEPATTRHAARAASPKLDEVATIDELHARVALEALSPPATRLSLPAADGPALGARFEPEPWMREATRASTIEKERWRFFSSESEPPRAHSGSVAREGLEAELAVAFAFDQSRPLSATGIDTFANCRFQGFARTVLRLDSAREPGEAIDAPTTGNLLHALLEKLIPSLAELGWPKRSALELPQSQVAAAIDAAVESAAELLERHAALGHPALWKVERQKAAKIAWRVLTQGVEGAPFGESEFVSAEQAFGPRAPAPWNEVKVPAALPHERDVWLRGTIDRVDRTPTGHAVVDYKLGRKNRLPKKPELLVTRFQLPLYLLAVKQALGVALADGAWLSLREGKSQHLAEQVEGTFETLLATDLPTRAAAAETELPNVANSVQALVSAVRRGDVGPRAVDCEHCDVRRVCRIRELGLEDDP